MLTEWKTNVHVKLNALNQSKNQTFHGYSTAVWNVDSLLHGTDSFLDDVKLEWTSPWPDACVCMTKNSISLHSSSLGLMPSKSSTLTFKLNGLNIMLSWRLWQNPCDTSLMMTVLSLIHLVNTMSPPHPQILHQLQMHLPITTQKTILLNSHLTKVLFSSTTTGAQNATSHVYFTPSWNVPMTSLKAQVTNPSPKQPLMLQRNWLVHLHCQTWLQALAHAQWLPSWITPPTLLDIPQTTHQWS